MAVYEEKESYAASRARGLGGTDVAAILNLSPWKKPIDIYAGKVDPHSQPELDKEMLWWGSALEPVVRGRYQERFGVQVIAPADLAVTFPKSRPWRDSTLIEGPEPWMLGAPDGWIPGTKCGLEIKCAARRSGEWGDEGGEDVPAHYFAQASWYAAVTDAAGWDFGVLFSGNTLEQFHINRDREFEKDMIDVARTFWHDYVLKQVEPPIDESESYGRYLARKFSLSTGQVITNPSQEILDYTAEMKAASEEVKKWEEREREANNHLRSLVGEAQKAVTPMGTVGWVRPEEKSSTNWHSAFDRLFTLTNCDPRLVEQAAKESTETKQGTPYLRAWWKK